MAIARHEVGLAALGVLARALAPPEARIRSIDHLTTNID
jgi:hypothetical protein